MLPFAANWHMGDIRVRTQPISCVKNALVRLLSPHSGQRHFERWYQKVGVDQTAWWKRRIVGSKSFRIGNNRFSPLKTF